MPKRQHIPNLIWRNGWAHFRARVNGRQVWRSLKTRSATEARRRVIETWEDIRAHRSVIVRQNAPERVTLEEALTRYLSMRGADLTPNTRTSHARRIGFFITWAREDGIRFIHEVKAETLLAYRAHRSARRSLATVASDLRPLASLLAHARLVGWTDADPFKHLPRGPRRPETQRVIHRWARIRRLLDATRDTPLGCAIAVAVFTGVRRAELHNLDRADIDYGARMIHIVNRDTFSTKSGRMRSIPLADALLDMPGLRGRGRLSPASSPSELTHAVSRVMGSAGLEGGIHGLRHNFITYALLAGYPTARVMGWAGHANLATTDGYTHVRQAVPRREVEAFRKAFGEHG